LTDMENTVIAQSSAKGQGAIAVVRMSGENAVKIFTQAVKADGIRHSCMKRYSIFDKNGEVIDDVTAVVFFAPKSFTGEDVAEIFCHGSQICVERIIKRFSELGAKIAGRGEFTKRAFLNGKINLHKAEAINAVISAKDYYSHKNAMAQYMGRGVAFFDEIRKELQNISVALESEIEFSETDELNTDFSEFDRILTDIRHKLSLEKQKYAQIQKIANGIPTVLLGRTNAGKSSIFNRILNEDRAIVNEKAGTTRDVIAETVNLNDAVIRLFDTAGLNESDDEIENEGIKRTKQEIGKAFAAIWVISPDDASYENDCELIKNIPALIAVLNKSDLGENCNQADFLKKNGIKYINFSAAKNRDAKEICDLLLSEIEEKFPEKTFDTVLTGKREEEIVERLIEIIGRTDFCVGIEIAAQQIREAIKVFDEIYGFMAADEIMNKIFDSFCIGK